MKTSLKVGLVFFCLAVLLLAVQVFAAVNLGSSQTASVKSTTTSLIMASNTPSGTSVAAENVLPGSFGANAAGSYKDYSFPAHLVVGSTLSAGGGVTVSQNLPSVLSFLPDRGPVLRAESNILKFIGGNIYYFDSKVGIKTNNPQATLDVNGSVNATDYYGDGNRGLTASYTVKNNSGQNCILSFTDGLLTASTCSGSLAPVKK